MAGSVLNAQPAPAPAEPLEESLARVAAMTINALRAQWQEATSSDPPSAFSKDLLARALCYRFQEEVLGGLSPATSRLLRSLIRPGAEPPRHVKAGSVIVREHKGVLHEVLVVPGGFCWQGKTYASLSTIAKRITGISWNGPRFFGLRSKKGDAVLSAELSASIPASIPRASSRRSTVTSGRGPRGVP